MPILADDTYAAAPASTAGNKIIVPTKVAPRQSFTITLEGSNQSLYASTSATNGDTLYLPWYYKIEGPNYYYTYGFFDDPPAKVTTSLSNPGVYTITAEYDKYEYDDWGIGGDPVYNWWYTDDPADVKVATITVATSVVATPAAKKYKVAFKGNKGKIGKKKTTYKTVTQKKKYGKLPKAKRKNYMFKGWYTKKKGGTKITASTTVTKAKKHTLYAQWIGPKGKNKTISKKEYKRVKKGMTLKQVRFLIGGKGKLESSSSSGGYKVKMYSWKGNGSIGSNAVIMFTNGKMDTKAQAGLK
jgi:uncharacterized repeat protein (TIGR02543 family)